jgi:hypothetical protein
LSTPLLDAELQPEPGVPHEDNEVVGRFQFGLLCNDRPHVLATWRVTSSDSAVIDRVAELLGGSIDDTINATSEPARSSPTPPTVDVFLSGPTALQVRWQRDALGNWCDGVKQQSERAGQSCRCRPSVPERKASAQQGRGCAPLVQVVFRLCQDPTLGMFTFTSGNWSFAKDTLQAVAMLERNGMPARVGLSIEQSHCMLRSGRAVASTRPTLSYGSTNRSEPGMVQS